MPQRLDTTEKENKEFIDLAFKEDSVPRNQWQTKATALLEAYQGRYHDAFGNKPKFTFNSIYNIVNTILPNLLFRKPSIRAVPLRSRFIKEQVDGKTTFVDAIDAANKLTGAINHHYRRNQIIEQDKKAIFDTLFYGIGVCKNGYSFDTISTPDKDIIVKDTPFRQRINPRDFGWHPLATGPDDSIKLVHRAIVPRKFLKKLGIKNKEDIESGLPRHLEDKIKLHGFDPDSFVVLHEVHDQEEDLILTYAGKGHWLADKRKNNFKFKQSHFDVIKLGGPNDEFLGVPPLDMIIDVAMVINEVMTLMVEHYRKFPSIVVVEENAMDPQQEEAFLNGSQGSLLKVRSKDGIEITNPTSMGTDYTQIATLMQVAMDRIMGVPDFNKLSGTQSRRSATEASAIVQETSTRLTHLLGLVKDFVLRGIAKQASLQAQFLDGEVYIEHDPELDIGNLTFDKKDLKPVLEGDVEWDFQIDEMRADNEAQLTALNNSLNILGAHPVLQRALTPLDPVKMGKFIFSKHNINYDAMKKNDVFTGPVFSPERENSEARQGNSMPAPKRGEDYIGHLREHRANLVNGGPNDQIMNHVVSTVLMALQDGEDEVALAEVLGENGQGLISKAKQILAQQAAQVQAAAQGAAQGQPVPQGQAGQGPTGPNQQVRPING